LLRQHTATIDWKTLLVRSRMARCSRGVLAGLQLASLMFDAPIPKAVHTAAAKDVCSRKLAVQFRGIILQSKPLNQVERIAATIMIHDRFWDRLILILATVRARFQPARGGIAARWIPLLIGKRVVPLVRRYGLGWLRLAAFLR
jgi:hypothetical protein